MHMPERRVASVHITFEADGPRAVHKRRGVHRSPVVRRFPPGRLVVADRSPVVVVVVAATVAKLTAATAKAIVAVVAVAVAFAVTIVVLAFAVVAAGAGAGAAAGTGVRAAIVIASGAQSAADEREQLLHVLVELVGQAGRAGAVRRVHPTDGVSHHVRFEVYRLGVTRRPMLLQVLVLVVVVSLQLLLLLLLLLILLLLLLLFLHLLLVLILLVLVLMVLVMVLRRVHIGRRGGDVQRRFRPIRFDHFHRRTVRPPLFRRRRRNAAVMHAPRCRSALGMRRPPSPGAPQTITPQRCLLVIHFAQRVRRCIAKSLSYTYSPRLCTVMFIRRRDRGGGGGSGSAGGGGH